jgi:cysteine desulfurase
VSTIYLDHNATTPVAAEVIEAMLPFLHGEFGTPSASYALGRRARRAIEQARGEVAALIGPSQRKSSSPVARRKRAIWRFAVPQH